MPERGEQGYSEPHWPKVIWSERYECYVCTECKALPSAPWHLPERRAGVDLQHHKEMKQQCQKF